MVKPAKRPELAAKHRLNRGADHEEIVADLFPRLYRRPRLGPEMFGSVLSCTVHHDGRKHGPFEILNVSDEGLAFLPSGGILLDQDQHIPRVDVRDEKGCLWTGRARCAYWGEDRVGVHITGGDFDLRALRARSALRANRVNRAMWHWSQRNRVLPAEWRAKVAQLADLFGVAQSFLMELAQSDLAGVPPNSNAELAAIAELYAFWWPECARLYEELHGGSAMLDPKLMEYAYEFSSGLMAPLVYGSPLLRRAIDKPLGYAGDYVQMCLFERLENGGASLYDRFVDHISKQSSVGSAVVARQRNIIEAIERCVAKDKPIRIVSLAAGPALEICKFIRSSERLPHPVEFVLIDQDSDALAYAQGALRECLAEKSDDEISVKITCVRIAMKQMLHLEAQDIARLERVIGGADLVYSAGLLDYLSDSFTSSLLLLMYTLLSPGGELFVGNARNTSQMWMLDYVLSWHLIYREREDLMRLIRPFRDRAAAINAEEDETGTCLFLSVTKP